MRDHHLNRLNNMKLHSIRLLILSHVVVYTFHSIIKEIDLRLQFPSFNQPKID